MTEKNKIEMKIKLNFLSENIAWHKCSLSLGSIVFLIDEVLSQNSFEKLVFKYLLLLKKYLIKQ